MKNLIVYFSHSGNNRLLAEHLTGLIGCDVCPIIENKKRTMLTIILDMMFKREPKINEIEYRVSNYDHIILVAPVWAAKIANPMQVFIKREKAVFPSYSFISLCGYKRPEQREAIIKELSGLIEKAPKAVCELTICDLLPIGKRNEIKRIANYHVKNEELVIYESEINEFLETIRDDVK